MHLTETASFLEKIRPKLTYQQSTLTTNNSKRNYLNGLTKFKSSILELNEIPALKQVLKPILDSVIFAADSDDVHLSDTEAVALSQGVTVLKSAIGAIISLAHTGDADEMDGIRIKLPSFHTFEELQKIVGDLKLAIDVPLNYSNVGAEVDIKRAETGSIWLVVGLGARIAGQFLSELAHLALNVRMKKIEGDKHVEYLKQNKANTEMLNAVAEFTKNTVKSYLDEQAAQIQNNYFDTKKANDALNIIKTATEAFGDLYEKGMIVQAAMPSAVIDQSSIIKFPSIDKIKELKDGIKQISTAEDSNQESA